MNLKTVVIVATKGRPREVAMLLDTLALQTVSPDAIVVSASDRSDVSLDAAVAENVEFLFGPSGSSVQRNLALSSVRGKFDIVVFFDDDFIPSRYWIERLQMLMATHQDVVCLTGQVLVDGITIGGIEWPDGQSIVNKADLSKKRSGDDYIVQNHRFPYGCNMAFRARNIEHLMFDERLIRYGWLEDRDFSFRAGARMIWTDAIWGVHLGTTRGRTSGLSFGYSQVVNPWYLMKKGSMNWFDGLRTIFRALVGNTVGSLSQSPHVDRRGRLKGNMIALRDIITGNWAPENVAGL